MQQHQLGTQEVADHEGALPITEGARATMDGEEAIDMWVVKAHGPDGATVEEFETESDALAAQQKYLGLGLPVLLDPTGKGLPLPRSCSFCGKDREHVGDLSSGPAGAGVVICDECVTLVSGIFAERPAAPVD